MAKMIKDINIYFGGETISRGDLAIALRMIADATEKGAISGICGWSTVSFEIEESEEDEREEK